MRAHGFGGCGHTHAQHRAASGLAGLAALAAAILTGGCHDGDHERDHWRRARGRVERALDWLDLEGDTRERARAVARRLAQEAAGLRGGGSRLAGEVLAQWRRDAPDAAELHAAVDREIEALRARALRSIEDVLELHAILDAEQRAELSDLLTSRRGRGRHRHRR